MKFIKLITTVSFMLFLAGCTTNSHKVSTGFSSDVDVSQYSQTSQKKSILIKPITLPASIELPEDVKKVISKEIQLNLSRIIGNWPHVERVDLENHSNIAYDSLIELTFDQYQETYSYNIIRETLFEIMTIGIYENFRPQTLECHYSATSKVTNRNKEVSTTLGAESTKVTDIPRQNFFSVSQFNEENDPCYQARKQLMKKILSHLSSELYKSN